MKRVIFVDDETNILDGLRRMLRSSFRSDEWELVFVSSGAQALSLMAVKPFDVIVTDMRMPGMDGVELLAEVMQRHPATIRFILSGHSDREAIMKSIGSTHQYLSKPCDPDLLIKTIRRAFMLREVLQKESLKTLVSRIRVLPSLPDLYLKVMAELKTGDASLQKVGALIAQDIGMSAKVLQMVNSAFFGLRQRVESPEQAVTLLGLDIVKSLVLMVQVFSGVKDHSIPGHSMEWLWQHSLFVARCSQAIMRRSIYDKKAADDAFMAGLFHDLGKLVLVTNLETGYAEVIKLMNDGAEILEAEERVFGSTHGEVGAYLLGLWGFPDPLIEAALYHHQPEHAHQESVTSLLAVHIANVAGHTIFPLGAAKKPPHLSPEFLKSLKVEERVGEWTGICTDIARQGGANAAG